MEQEEARNRYENPKKRIKRIFLDIEDPKTQLIGEKITEASTRDVRNEGETFYEQLWRTNDAHYFLYSGADLTLLDVKTAHNYMNTVWACRKFLTDEDKRDVMLDDEKSMKGDFREA